MSFVFCMTFRHMPSSDICIYVYVYIAYSCCPQIDCTCIYNYKYTVGGLIDKELKQRFYGSLSFM